MAEPVSGRRHAILDHSGNVVWRCSAASRYGDGALFGDQSELLASVAAACVTRSADIGEAFVYGEFTITSLHKPVAIVEWRKATEGGIFSRRQTQVLDAMVNDVKPKHAIERLGISMSTYETHRREILRRTNCVGSATLARWCVANGLID